MWPCLEAYREILLAFPPTNGGLFPPFRVSDFRGSEAPAEPGPIMDVLIRMREGVELFINSSPTYNRQRTSEAVRLMPPEVWIPDFDEQAEFALFPLLRPVGSYNENWMMPIHRCLCILQYFDLTHGSEERREEWLQLHEAIPAHGFEVTSADMPWWMPGGV